MANETGPWTKYQRQPSTKHEAFVSDLANSKDFSSAAWRGVSAIAKNKVANSLADGNLKQAADIAARALGWGILRSTPSPKAGAPPEKPTATAAPPQKPTGSTTAG